jgi:hypothetical protein
MLFSEKRHLESFCTIARKAEFTNCLQGLFGTSEKGKACSNRKRSKGCLFSSRFLDDYYRFHAGFISALFMSPSQVMVVIFSLQLNKISGLNYLFFP